MSRFSFKLRNTRIYVFVIFLVSLLTNLGLADGFIEHKIEPKEFTSLLLKIIGIYGVHIAIMLAGFFNTKTPENDNAVLKNNDKTAARIILALSVCWNFLMGMTITNFYFHPEMKFSDFTDRLEAVSGAINFLVAGGLAYFFNKKEED